jgi:3-oxoacyl-[acyl-carrier protein] reductase
VGRFPKRDARDARLPETAARAGYDATRVPSPLALITGASRGIGRATALELAAAGYDVIATARTRTDLLDAVAAEVRALGRVCHTAAFDVADAAATAGALRPLLAETGTPDALVSNAGITRDALFALMPQKDWDDVIATSLGGFSHVTAAVVRGMVGRRSGRIVAISSVSGQLGTAGQVNYSAAKAGLIGAAKALSRELGRFGITVNVVAPGLIDTDMLPKEAAARLVDRVPLARVGTPAEVAKAVRFLVGPDASYITGQVLGVNGGLC